MANIFRQALEILGKNGARTEAEEKLLAAATIPLDILPEFNDLTTKEGLEDLARIVEGRRLMISNKTAAKIAELSAKTIEDRLKYTAYELVVEEFCLKRCGHTPDGELCDEAERTHRLFVALLFRSYSKSN